MPFPPEDTMANLFTMVINDRAFIRSRAEELSAFMAANTVSGALLIQFASDMAAFVAIINKAKNHPGMQQYVKDQLGDQARDFSSEMQSFITKIQDLISTVRTAYPKDANGWLLERQMDADGSVSVRQFTPGQTAAFRPKLDAIASG
jgi:hypothetical protein